MMITTEDLARSMLDLQTELKNSSLRHQASQEKSEQKMQASYDRMQASQEKSDRRLDKLGKLIGNIGNNQGDIAEEFFYNSLKAKPTMAGINYDFVDKNVTRSKNGIEDEYDILLVNGRDIAIIETKYKAHTADIERLVDKKHANFKKLYPEYQDYTHHLGLASFNMNDDVKALAALHKVVLLQRKGDIIETILP